MLCRATLRPFALLLLVLGALRLDAAQPPLGQSPFAALIASPEAPANARGWSEGNQVAMLSNGYDALTLRVHLIRAAVRSIDVQTFIWTNDEVGRLMVWELMEAARRGVKVRIIADHLFSDQEPDIIAFLDTVHPNFQVKHYRPPTSRLRPGVWRTALAFARSFRSANQRMHNKVMLIDGAILITGGRNIENTYYDHSVHLNFRDRDVVALGPVVRTAAAQFEEFWSYRETVPSRELVDVSAALKRGTFRRFDRREDFDFGGYFTGIGRDAGNPALIEERFARRLQPVSRARFLYDSPGKSRALKDDAAAITRDLAAVLQGTKSEVLMQTPYLVLSSTARDLLRELRQRKPAVEIRVSTNSFASTDNLYAYSANYRLRNDYVQSLGLLIHEFKPLPAELLSVFPTHPDMCDAAERRTAPGEKSARPFLSLHAKSLVVDDRIAFVGSFNLDPRSERLNTEVGLLVDDAGFASALRAEIERDMQPENSWVIARRRLPLRLEAVNGLIDGVLSLTPIDLWPIQNTTSFDLLPQRRPVRPDDPAFYDCYREVSPFPGAEGPLSQKQILTRLYKAVGSPRTPML